MKIIKSAGQLPEWFSLEKYDGVSQFELADWWAAFSLRHYMGIAVDCDVPDGVEGPSWHLLTDDGRLSHVKAWARITQYGSAAHVGFWYDPFHHGNSSVESISVQDFFHITNTIGEIEDNKYRLAFDAFEAEVEADANTDRLLADRIGDEGISPDACLLENAHDVLDPHAYWRHDVAFAQVDLLASDATIEDNFRAWLRDVRSQHQHVTFKRERRYSSRDAMNWANSGVLPYLDLSIWAELEGVEISDSVYGDAIFGPNRLINVTEAVRKVTAPLAGRIWTGELPNSLESDLSGRVLESQNPA